MTDRRLHWPAPVRNRDPILEVLRRVLPPRGTVLEVSAGSGQHAAWFATHLPELTWHPTDLDPEHLVSIDAWAEDCGAPNLRPAAPLDVRDDAWPLDRADAVYCANMIHIAPWEAALGLLDGVGRLLRDGGVFALYGPFTRDGRHTAPSNERFDASLKARDPSWGVRDLDHFATLAASRGLRLDEAVAMPANNLTAVFRLP
ncbi:MAG: DUF938 domain-containing protein [Proteobacteria bacterium]|nr:DUF938 domain-containing protein [Pseudomonadota bacterium]